ncbi:unnamed protein product [Brachionus calyciflorus]|uniref:Methyltransferase domain-containing protein n=1 Tax=Brachionus calyciflorus TaxID=104777 RepID=A0A813QJA5_9BILA|nr:unnamed protein product [Brachionus calyciflorus]
MRSLENFKNVLDELIDFVEENRSLLDTNHVQFLVDNHWFTDSILNPSLRNDLEYFIKEKSGLEKGPVNLIRYFSELFDFDPKLENLNSLFFKLRKLFEIWDDEICTDQSELLKTDKSELIEFNKMVNDKFSVIQKQNRFMNLKKSYEVDHMSKFVGTLCRKHEIYTIVDIGSGRAYLSSQLSSSIFDNKFNLIAIDSSQSNVESSIKRINVMKRKTQVFDQKQQQEADRFKTFSQFIQSSTELHNLVRENTENKLENENYALVGLHSCGNLSNSIINLFLNNSESDRKLLCNVACCYNLLNEKYAKDPLSNYDFKKTDIKLDDSSKFPMSAYLNSNQYALTYNLRMLACHSLYRCLDSIENYKELNNATLWYRTMLQLILYENYLEDFPNQENSTEINLQVGRKMLDFDSMPPFVEYVRKVIKKFNLNNDKLTDDQINEYMNKHESMKPKLDIYIQIKYLMAPIIEYIILLDRLIYLYEIDNLEKFDHYLVKLFDPAKSPRCHALISFNK